MAAAAAVAGDLAQLYELFAQFDRGYLERVYRERGSLTLAVDHCLEVTSRGLPGATATNPAVHARPNNGSSSSSSTSGAAHGAGGGDSDMILDYKTVVPPATPGADTPMRQGSVPPMPSSPAMGVLRGGPVQLTHAIIEQRRDQYARVLAFLRSHGLQGTRVPLCARARSHARMYVCVCMSVCLSLLSACID
jgi:hypothetical protein